MFKLHENVTTWDTDKQSEPRMPWKIPVIVTNTLYREIFRVGKFWRKCRLQSVLNYHRVVFSLFQGLSMKTCSRVYFSLCLFLRISGRSQTQRKLSPREKYENQPDLWVPEEVEQKNVIKLKSLGLVYCQNEPHSSSGIASRAASFTTNIAWWAPNSMWDVFLLLPLSSTARSL